MHTNRLQWSDHRPVVRTDPRGSTSCAGGLSAKLAAMRGEFLDVGGVRLYYYAAGRRGPEPPVVLLHGFATSSHLWSSVAPLVAARRRVIVLDLLGHGRSDRPNGQAVNLRGHADRTVALLDQLNVNRAIVVGHEVGGAIGLMLAVRHPLRVAGLCLVSSVGYADWPRKELRLARAMLPLTRTLPAGWLTSLLRTDLHRGFLEPDRALRSSELYLRPFAGPEGRDALLEHLLQLDPADTLTLAPRLKDIVAPTNVVWGDADPFIPASTGVRLAREIPGATARPLANVSHFSPEEAPEQVTSAILELIDR